MDLHRIQDDVYYIPGAVNVGVIVGRDSQAVLIDSGIGDRSGRQILQLLEGQGLKPAAILNTHAHGDHTGARVYAPELDAMILQYPIWGTFFLFAGAEPIQELAAPRYAPHPCAVDVLIREGVYEVAGLPIRAISLPGHTGYWVQDVLFCGDILAGEQELASAKIIYAYSITQRLESLRKLQSLSCAWYVLAHDAPRRDISELVTRNLAQMEETMSYVLRHVADRPGEAADILDALCQHYGIHLRQVRDHSLLSLTLFDYLSHLHNSGQLAFVLERNRLLWRSVAAGFTPA